MNIRYLLPMVVFLLLIVGCGQNAENVGPSMTPFVGGTNALSAAFVPGAPPEFIFDNGGFPFGISIDIQNLGEAAVKANEGYIEILGINPKDFGLASQVNLRQNIPAEIRGAKKNFDGTVIAGDRTILDFTGLNYQPDLTGNFYPTLRAGLCYNYETKASTLICVKKDLLTGIENKEICSVSGDLLVSNSGAPIQIIKMTQAPIGDNEVQISFTIAHVGLENDRFYKTSTDCDDRPTNVNKDVVGIEVQTQINGKYAKCSGMQEASANGNAGYVTLYSGAPRQVVCTFDTTGVDYVSQQPVLISLKYRYSQFIERPLEIRDVTIQQ